MTNKLAKWRRMGKGAETSNVAHFIEGWKDGEGTTIIIWKGVEELDDGQSQIYLPGDPPEDAEFVVELSENGAFQRRVFAKNRTEAFRHALTEMVDEDI